MLRRILISSVLLGLLGLLSATRAKADGTFTYQFNGDTFTWQLPQSPTPTDYTIGVYFDITNVAYSENGVPQAPGTFDFYNAGNGGGFDLYVGTTVILNNFGSQVYTGPESAPTFLSGQLFTLNNGTPTGPSGSLTTTTPEPSILLLIAAGLLSLLFLGRKRLSASQAVG